ncbi:MAG: hypothetical protein R2876_05335 [Eubacteriales bacterium]
MKTSELSDEKQELKDLCNKIRTLAANRNDEQGWQLILYAMSKYPHAPQPHNLIGILLKKRGDHLKAMKHFRAAWALDPTYLPARQNLDSFGTFFSRGKYAFDEEDCPSDKHDQSKIEYDEHGIGHIVRRVSR